jgi:predicted RNA binding protein YcfA (HicA-like mRNA interferase family)
MSQWQPCKRRLFIKRLRKLGFDGPYSGTHHQFMVYENHRLTIPTNREYSVPQLKMMINEVESIIGRHLSTDEWSDLA